MRSYYDTYDFHNMERKVREVMYWLDLDLNLHINVNITPANLFTSGYSNVQLSDIC